MAKDAGATASQGKSGQVAGSTTAGGAMVGHAGRGWCDSRIPAWTLSSLAPEQCL
jgi:hypothetical protein